jgi:thiamine kinase-like enzyme
MGVWLDAVVLSNGHLDDRKIWKREILYKGMNGRNVERFYVSSTESYVFKPLTNNEQMGKETWVYEHLLVDFPAIYPKIVAKSTNDLPNPSWIIFEDLGHLKHIFNEEIVLNVTKLVSFWHALSTAKCVGVPLKGPKPFIEEIVSSLFLRKKQVVEILWRFQIPRAIIEKIYFLLKQFTFSKKKVISHGDLHLGNYATRNNQVIVLDWEYMHLNTPFWDLYHLLDGSHPVFPKRITRELRENALDYYLEQVEQISGNKFNRQAFKTEYYLFSTAFSMWMMMLIHQDLLNQDGKWELDQLKSQLNETIIHFVQCAEQIANRVHYTY